MWALKQASNLRNGLLGFAAARMPDICITSALLLIGCKRLAIGLPCYRYYSNRDMPRMRTAYGSADDYYEEQQKPAHTHDACFVCPRLSFRTNILAFQLIGIIASRGAVANNRLGGCVAGSCPEGTQREQYGVCIQPDPVSDSQPARPNTGSGKTRCVMFLMSGGVVAFLAFLESRVSTRAITMSAPLGLAILLLFFFAYPVHAEISRFTGGTTSDAGGTCANACPSWRESIDAYLACVASACPNIRIVSFQSAGPPNQYFQMTECQPAQDWRLTSNGRDVRSYGMRFGINSNYPGPYCSATGSRAVSEYRCRTGHIPDANSVATGRLHRCIAGECPAGTKRDAYGVCLPVEAQPTNSNADTPKQGAPCP